MSKTTERPVAYLPAEGQAKPGAGCPGEIRGLTAALEALGGRVDVVGTSGFTTREYVLLATSSLNEAKLVKGA